MRKKLVRSIFFGAALFLLPATQPLRAQENLLNVGEKQQITTEIQQVEIRQFEITGNTLIETSRLEKLLSSYVGRKLSFVELKAAADAVTNEYFTRGYVNSYAWLPVQEIDGVVKIQVSEGAVGSIKVSGDHSYSSSFIRKHLEGSIGSTGALDSRKLERGLLILNDYPNLKVQADLEAGAEAGKTDIYVAAGEKKPAPLNGSVFASNHGSRYTGRNRFGASWRLGNLTGSADYLDLTLMTSPNHESWRNMLYGKAAYYHPLGYQGTKLRLEFAVSGYDLGGRLKPLGIVGDSEVFTIGLSHPLRRSREKNLYLMGAVSRRDYKNYLFERTFNTSTDQYSVFEIGLNGDCSRQRRSLAWSVLLSGGLGEFFGGMSDRAYANSSRPALADGSWTKINLSANTGFRLNNMHRLQLRCEGQLSGDPLLSSEQGSIGGPDSVRAYPVAEYTGDQSYLLSAEYHVPFFRNGKPRENAAWVVFVDHGGTKINDRLPGEKDGSLSGCGLGLRFVFARNLSLSFDAAVPLGDEDASDGDHARFWLSLSQPF